MNRREREAYIRWEMRKVTGIGIGLFGILIAANGVTSGPQAFWGGMWGVIGSCVAGLLLVGCALIVLSKKGKDT
jgi:hypothetical protein